MRPDCPGIGFRKPCHEFFEEALPVAISRSFATELAVEVALMRIPKATRHTSIFVARRGVVLWEQHHKVS